MTKKTSAVLLLVLALLVSMVGTAAAQSGDGPTPTPVPTEPPDLDEPEGETLFTHPIVQVLSKYFGRSGEPAEPEDPTATPDPAATPDPTDPTEIPEEPPVVAPPTVEEIAEQIAAYHEQGVGFGVLVKLYAMAEASAVACAEAPVVEGEETAPCTVVTVEELVQAHKSGTGMGELFKEYGKPALLGVGHVRQELKKLQKEEGATPVEEPGEAEDGDADEAMLVEGKGGKPDTVGKPDKAGKPEKAGKPDKPGKPEKPVKDKGGKGNK